MVNLFDIAVAKKLSGGGGGGGGGLEYEEGIFTPSEDITNPTISFAKEHTTPPALIVMTIVDNAFVGQNTNVEFVLENYVDLFGTFKRQSNQTFYGFVSRKFRDTGSFVGGSTANITTSSGINDYANGKGFTPANTNSIFWKSEKTYKWIAIWLKQE